MGNILHDWNLENKKILIKKAYEALPKGGALIVVENLIDDARRKNTFGLLMSLNMLIEFGDAFDYTAADFREWCTEAGFSDFEVVPLAGPTITPISRRECLLEADIDEAFNLDVIYRLIYHRWRQRKA